MTVRVDTNPAVLLWAIARARLDPDEVVEDSPRVGAWIEGT